MDEMRLEEEEPIFELASSCGRLFGEQLHQLEDHGATPGAIILAELRERFANWAAFLGVLAEPSTCLDRRLRRHGVIQDQVLRLLDIIAQNLTFRELPWLQKRVAAPVANNFVSIRARWISRSHRD